MNSERQNQRSQGHTINLGPACRRKGPEAPRKGSQKAEAGADEAEERSSTRREMESLQTKSRSAPAARARERKRAREGKRRRDPRFRGPGAGPSSGGKTGRSRGPGPRQHSQTGDRSPAGAPDRQRAGHRTTRRKPSSKKGQEEQNTLQIKPNQHSKRTLPGEELRPVRRALGLRRLRQFGSPSDAMRRARHGRPSHDHSTTLPWHEFGEKRTELGRRRSLPTATSDSTLGRRRAKPKRPVPASGGSEPAGRRGRACWSSGTGTTNRIKHHVTCRSPDTSTTGCSGGTRACADPSTRERVLPVAGGSNTVRAAIPNFGRFALTGAGACI